MLLFVLPTNAAPTTPPAMAEYRRPPGYRTLSRSARFGVGFEVAGGGIIGPSVSARLTHDLWLALAVKPRLSVVGADEGDLRLNAIATLSLSYPLATVRRWSFRAQVAAGGTIPLRAHFESVASLGPSVAFWTRKGAQLAWSIGPGLYPYRNINYTEADWQGFLYLDFSLRFHPGARRGGVPTEEPEAPEAPEPNGWRDVLE